jgi:endo-1,4-beta-xylanase
MGRFGRRKFLTHAGTALVAGAAGAAAGYFGRKPAAECSPLASKETLAALLASAQARKDKPRWGGGFLSLSALSRCFSPEQVALYKDLFRNLFDILTPENAFKWAEIERTPGNYDWSDTDALIEWASSGPKPLGVKMHCALWGAKQGVPDWVVGMPDADVRKALLRFVEAVATRYKGAFWAWDVINEPVHEPYYLKRLPGIDKELVDMLRSLVPSAVLLVNDNDIILYPEGVAQKGITDEVEPYTAGLGITNLGLQSHDRRWYTLPELKATFNRLKGNGFSAHLTEIIRPSNNLPVYVGGYDAWQSMMRDGMLGRWTEERQADAYEEMFLAAAAHEAVATVTLWNFSDALCWDEFPEGGIVRADLSTKPAYDRLLKLRAQVFAKPADAPKG